MIPQLALAWYGDDFTGSTDVMEVLTWAGLPAVLFFGPPDDAQLARFPDARAVGIAGESRGCSPAWMDEQLPPIYGRLRQLGAPLVHYKVCSTFDSAPETGSIGRALELGLEAFGASWAPIVVGAPNLSRYQAFGNLFATVGEETYRIDRHPTMSRHPVTPMDEGDLRRHLARQTKAGTSLIDLVTLKSGRAPSRLDAVVESGAQAVFVDVVDEETLVEAGRLVWENRGRAPFSVSSSGLQYALVAYWRQAGWLERAAAPAEAPEADRVLVLSGSCSPETEASIRRALEQGYAGVRLDAAETAAGRIEPAVEAAARHAAEGRSVVLYSALGPDDAAVSNADPDFRRKLGEHSGRLLKEGLERTGIRRAIVCGGDTSSRAGARLGVYALTAICPMAPGSPLCRAWADGPFDGLELVLKGGQRGGPEFFEEVRRGRPAA